MKQFALVGFLAALLATQLEAQVLFNVTVDPSLGKVVITATSESVTNPFDKFSSTATQNRPPRLSDGILLTNFFLLGAEQNLAVGAEINPTTSTGILANLRPNSQYSDLDNPTYTATGPTFAAAFNDYYSNRTLGDPDAASKATDLALYTFAAPLNQSYVRFTTTERAFSGEITLQFPSSDYVSALRTSGGGNVVYGNFLGYEGVDSRGVLSGSNQYGEVVLGTYTISVVPEPSTYAAIAGGLGLAAAVIHRRRQRAKAAQG